MLPDWAHVNAFYVYPFGWRVGEELPLADSANRDDVARFHSEFSKCKFSALILAAP